MSNDNELDNVKAEQDFVKWLESGMPANKPNESQPNQENSNVWQDRHETAKQFNHQAQGYLQEKVPNWNRAAAFPKNDPWWHWQGIPAVSMAFSMCALLLVLFKVEFSMSEQGMLISFAGAEQKQQQIAKLVDEKLAEFAINQQLALATYSGELIENQKESNLQLASYILSTSRQERKEDFNDFVRFINEQRKDEAQQQRIKFQQLEDAILYQSAFNQQANVGSTPDNWIVEE